MHLKEDGARILVNTVDPQAPINHPVGTRWRKAHTEASLQLHLWNLRRSGVVWISPPTPLRPTISSGLGSWDWQSFIRSEHPTNPTTEVLVAFQGLAIIVSGQKRNDGRSSRRTSPSSACRVNDTPARAQCRANRQAWPSGSPAQASLQHHSNRLHPRHLGISRGRQCPEY